MAYLVSYLVLALVFVVPLVLLLALYWVFRVISGRTKVSRWVYGLLGGMGGFLMSIPVAWQLMPSDNMGPAIGHSLPLASVLALTIVGVKQGLRYATRQAAVKSQAAPVEGMGERPEGQELEGQNKTQ